MSVMHQRLTIKLKIYAYIVKEGDQSLYYGNNQRNSKHLHLRIDMPIAEINCCEKRFLWRCHGLFHLVVLMTLITLEQQNGGGTKCPPRSPKMQPSAKIDVRTKQRIAKVAIVERRSTLRAMHTPSVF